MTNSKTPDERNLDKINEGGDTTAPTSIDGNTFSFLSKEGTLNLRLSNADLQAFMTKHDVAPAAQYDDEMKDFVSTLHPVLDGQKHLKQAFEKP